MPYDLRGKNVLVTGGSRGLGAVICRKFAEQGARVAINFNVVKENAMLLGVELERTTNTKCSIVQGDMADEKSIIDVIKQTIFLLGGLDIIISNAGYTRFSDFNDLSSPTAEDWDLCYAVNVKANAILMREALPIFNKNSLGGVFIMTSSIAGVTVGGSCMPYAVTKAAQLHLMKCMAGTQGPKVRINAILPGLLLTDWGRLYGPERIQELQDKAWLKKDTDLEDCAAMYVAVAQNTSMTGQQIRVDAGLAQ